MYYNRFRDYAPGTGRYVQSDPIGLYGGTNSFAYAANNPLNRVDPMGLWSFSFDAYGGIGGGITVGAHNQTGKFFIKGRLGLGFKIGGGLNILDNGPTDLKRRKTPYSKECSALEAGYTGFSVGGFADASISASVYGGDYGAKGGRFFDGTGHSYSTPPGFTPSFDPLGGGSGSLRASVGGALSE